MSRLIDNIKRLAEIVKNETKSGANTAVRIGGLFGEIAAELERKYDKTESDEQMREHDTNAEAHQNIQDRIDGVLGGLSENKLDKTGDGKDVVVSFQEATDRVNVETGDSLSVLAGKVRKWFAGLQTVAFSGRTEDLVSDADHRLVTDTEKARWNDTYTKQETDNKDSAVLDTAKKYVMDRISDVISGSPAALDTLYEIANALNNDPNFATTIMALINGKADAGHKHTKSQITDFPSSMPASDVYTWAKQATKPSYSYSEVGAAAANHNHNSVYQPKGSYAAASHEHDTVKGNYTGSGGQQAPSYVPSGKVRFNMMNTPINGDGSYKDFLLMDTYTGSDVPVTTGFGISKSAALRAFIMQGTKGGSSWARSAELYTTANFNPSNYAAKSHTHTADQITDTTTKVMMTKAERSKLASLETGYLKFHSRYLCGGSKTITCRYQAGTTWKSPSCVKTGNGKFTVTHNLGTNNYIVVLVGKEMDDGNNEHQVYTSLLSRTSTQIKVLSADDNSMNDCLFWVDILIF